VTLPAPQEGLCSMELSFGGAVYYINYSSCLMIKEETFRKLKDQNINIIRRSFIFHDLTHQGKSNPDLHLPSAALS
jgi:hypothetical protein